MWADREKNPEKYPFGQLPTLEVDGVVIAQAHVIERFLAKRFGRLGNTDVERAQIEATCEHCADIFDACLKAYFTPDKAANLANHYEKYFPEKAEFLERILKKNGTGWLHGKSFTLADIVAYQNVLMTGDPDLVTKALEGKAPMLLALKGKVESILGVAKWLETRPKFPTLP